MGQINYLLPNSKYSRSPENGMPYAQLAIVPPQAKIAGLDTDGRQVTIYENK